MSPPGQTATLQPTGGSTPTRAGSHIELTIIAAHKALLDSGVQISPRKVNRIDRGIARLARRNKVTFHEYLSSEAELTDRQRRALASHPDLAGCIAYLDPTGETAVNRVMRKRGH